MSYVIMRLKKLKTRASVASSGRHTFRERDTPNADKTLTCKNTHEKARDTNDLMRRLTENIPKERRKNAVLAVEYMFTASPEWWQTATQEQRWSFESRAKKFLTEIYGDENIIQFSIHRDEKTPHVSAIVTPMHDGKLNCRHFCGGRDKLAAQQDRIAELMSDLGLERGIKGSKAKHKTIQKYYAELQKTEQAIEPITEQELKARKTGFLHVESLQGVADRVNNRLKTQYTPLQRGIQRLHEVEYENKSLRAERAKIEPFLTLTQKLPKHMQEDLIHQLDEISRRYQEERMQKYERERKQRELERQQRSRSGVDHHFSR